MLRELDGAEPVGAADPLPFEHDGKEDLPQPQSGQGEVEILELENRAADDERHQARCGGARHPGREGGHSGALSDQHAAHVGADAIERHVPERKLSRLTEDEPYSEREDGVQTRPGSSR